MYTAGEAKVQLDPFLNVTAEQVPPLLLLLHAACCARMKCATKFWLQTAACSGSFSLGVGSLPVLICSCLLLLGAARTSHQVGRRKEAFSA